MKIKNVWIDIYDMYTCIMILLIDVLKYVAVKKHTIIHTYNSIYVLYMIDSVLYEIKRC